MKKNILISSIFGVSALVAFAQDATPTYDLYYDKVISDTAPQAEYISGYTGTKTFTKTVDKVVVSEETEEVSQEGISYKYKDAEGNEQTYTGALGANTDVNLNVTIAEGTDVSLYNNKTLFKVNETNVSKNITGGTEKTVYNIPALTLGNLTFNIDSKTGNSATFKLLEPYSNPLTLESFNINLTTATTTNSIAFDVNTGTNYPLAVNKDVIVTYDSDSVLLHNMALNFKYCSQMTVGGDFIVSNKTGKVELDIGSMGASWSSKGFVVEGVLSLNSKAGTKSYLKIATGNWSGTRRTLGGLDVAHDGVLLFAVQSGSAYNGENGRVVNLTFTNSDSHEFVGSIAQTANSSGHKFNITMNAADAANGRQILRFDEYIDAETSYKDAGDLFNNIIVNSGRLDIGMHANGMYAKSFALNGVDATFSSTSTVANEEIGMSTFGVATLTKGTLVFDYSIDANDSIAINDALTVANASDITITLQEIDGSDIKTWLQDEGMDSITFDIITFGSTNLTEESIANINVVSSNGMDTVLSAIKTDGVITGIQATIAVPEPATVAGIFGLFALAFVAYRRRK